MLPPEKSIVETCPACSAALVLERVLPKFSLLPAARILRCLRCGEVLTQLGENPGAAAPDQPAKVCSEYVCRQPKPY
jgi:hypothetical protein